MSRTGWFKHLVRLSAPWCVIAISQIAHNVMFCGPLRGMVAFSPKITRMEKLSFHMVVNWHLKLEA